MTPCGCRSSARSRCCSDGRVQAVAGVKLQSLLALLALAAPHTVSDDRLIEELWGDEQPGNPANALQALASHLRRLLGRDVVARQGPGYVLRLDPDLIDASRLERLVQQARQASARGDHGVAVDTYRSAVGARQGCAAGRPRRRLVRPRRRRPPGGAGARRPRGPRRRRADDGPARRRARRPRRAGRPLPAARALPGPVDHRAVPLGPAGRRAAGVPGRPRLPPRRARPRSRARSCRASNGRCWPTIPRSRRRSR